MAAGAVPAADEWTHPHDDDPWWNESWYFDFAAPDGSVGGYVRIGRYPNQRVVWYWAALVRPGRPTVLIRDHGIPQPARDTLEIRHDGLWADHVCETPLDHWSLGLEAFGVALDHPADAFGDERGYLTPLGFELDWDTAGPPHPYPGLTRYEVPCRVHGQILVGDESIELDGVGERDHSWGHRDWWTVPWRWTTFHEADGTMVHGMALPPETGIDFHAGFVYGSGGEVLATDQGFTADDEVDADALLVRSHMTYGDRAYEVEPLAHAPVKISDEQRGTTRLVRALCRWTPVGGGPPGVGWYERSHMPA